jgi:hypothetical protein
MVHRDFVSFFTVMAEGGAALLGLLFVAVSIRRAGQGARPQVAEAVVLADAALFALADGFIVSASALHPRLNVAYLALTMSLFGLAWAISALNHLAREWARNFSPQFRWYRLRVVIPNLIGPALLIIQVDAAVRLSIHSGDESATGLLATAVLGYYSLALLRAWALVGGAHYGLRAALLETPAPVLLRERHLPHWPHVHHGPRGPSPMSRHPRYAHEPPATGSGPGNGGAEEGP